MFGEILLTVGVLTLLYVSWHTWIGDAIVQSEQHAAAQALAEEWANEAPETPGPSETPAPDATAEPEGPAAIPVLGEQSHGDVFGIMKVPRFGSNWQFKIASGITRPDILDRGEIGHYPDTAMPGAAGNTAYAAHRWT